ncbi:MAG: hypothetical protein ACREFB_01850 [Stellaceae bacterium]
MSRFWALLPLVVVIGLPLLTGPSVFVAAAAEIAGVLGAAGILGGAFGLVTASGVAGTIGYAMAAATSGEGTDLAALGRQWRGAAVSAAALRGQVNYWLARSAIIVLAAVPLLLCAAAVARSSQVPQEQ